MAACPSRGHAASTSASAERELPISAVVYGGAPSFGREVNADVGSARRGVLVLQGDRQGGVSARGASVVSIARPNLAHRDLPFASTRRMRWEHVASKLVNGIDGRRVRVGRCFGCS